MIGVTNEKADRQSIAELQRYGLSLRIINALEVNFTYIYIDELQELTEPMLLGMPLGGPVAVKSIRRALLRWLAKEPVMTGKECARGSND